MQHKGFKNGKGYYEINQAAQAPLSKKEREPFPSPYGKGGQRPDEVRRGEVSFYQFT